MKYSIIKSISLLAVVSVSLFSCDTQENINGTYAKDYHLKRQTPFESIKNEPTKTKLQAEQGGLISLESGTVISVPANAFVDANGKVYKGEVDVVYQEYLTLGDIMLSGLPMKYDSAGVAMDFSSAGMFEIRAKSSNNEDLFLGKSKSINVDMASNYDGDYNLYYLEEEKQKVTEKAGFVSFLQVPTSTFELQQEMSFVGWRFKENSKVKENKAKKALKDSLENLANLDQPEQPQKSSDVSVFEFDIQTKGMDELKGYNNLFWTYAGEDKKLDPDNNGWIYSTAWTEIDFTASERPNVYNLVLSKGTKKFATEIKPVFAGKDYDKAMKRFNRDLGKFKEQLEARDSKRTIAKLMRPFIRSMDITVLGAWNCDKPFTKAQADKVLADAKKKAAKTMRAKLVIDGSELTPKSVFLCSRIGLPNNRVTQYWQMDSYDFTKAFANSEFDSFYYNPIAENSMVISFPNNKIGYITEEDFAKIDFNKVKESGEIHVNITMLDKLPEGKEGFSNFVASL